MRKVSTSSINCSTGSYSPFTYCWSASGPEVRQKFILIFFRLTREQTILFSRNTFVLIYSFDVFAQLRGQVTDDNSIRRTYTVTSYVQLFISEGSCCCWASFSFFSETFSGLGAESQRRTSCDHTVFGSAFIEDGGTEGQSEQQLERLHSSHIQTLLTVRGGEQQRPSKNILEATFRPSAVSPSWDTTDKMHWLHIYSRVSPSRHLSLTLFTWRPFSSNVTLRTGNLNADHVMLTCSKLNKIRQSDKLFHFTASKSISMEQD